MPFVNVKVAGSLTQEQKEQLSDRISQALLDIVDKPKAATYIVFDEVPRENWAKGEKLLG